MCVEGKKAKAEVNNFRGREEVGGGFLAGKVIKHIRIRGKQRLKEREKGTVIGGGGCGSTSSIMNGMGREGAPMRGFFLKNTGAVQNGGVWGGVERERVIVWVVKFDLGFVTGE